MGDIAIVVGEEERSRKRCNDREMEFIYLSYFHGKKEKKEKPRKLRGGRARNNGAVGSVPGISRCGVMNRVVV